MNDAISATAMRRAVNLSADIEVQLLAKEGGQPVIALIAKAQHYAAEATLLLAEADPEDPKAIRALQNHIRCYELILEWIREIVRDGFDAAAVLDMEQREDLADALGITEDEAQDVIRSGLPPQED